MSIAIVSASAGGPVRANNDNGRTDTEKSDDGVEFANILFGMPTIGANPAAVDRDPDSTETRGDAVAAAQVDPTAADPALLTTPGFSPALAAVAAPIATGSPTSPTDKGTIDGSPTATATTGAGNAAEGRVLIGDDRQPPAASFATIDEKAANFAVAQLAARSSERTAHGEEEPVATAVTLAHLNSPPLQSAVAGRDAPRGLDVPLRDPAWSSDFGQKLLWLAGNDRQVAQLSLHPPQLGAIDIILNVDKNSADAHFVSPNADVRGTIEAAVPRLREMFAVAGIDLGQVSVGSESFQRQTGDQPGQPRQSRAAADNAILGSSSASALPGKTVVARRGHGLIDIFA